MEEEYFASILFNDKDADSWAYSLLLIFFLKTLEKRLNAYIVEIRLTEYK